MTILGLEIGDFIAALVLAFIFLTALTGGIYAIVTNTKRLELSEAYKKELISWYNRVLFAISELFSDAESKNRALGELSALIDVGRLYFPNVIRGDGYGDNLPIAHQGYRHVALSVLVRIYNIARFSDMEESRQEIENLRRQFNSIIFYIISPRERIKNLKLHASVIVPPPAAYHASSDLDALNVTDEWIKRFTD